MVHVSTSPNGNLQWAELKLIMRRTNWYNYTVLHLKSIVMSSVFCSFISGIFWVSYSHVLPILCIVSPPAPTQRKALASVHEFRCDKNTIWRLITSPFTRLVISLSLHWNGLTGKFPTSNYTKIATVAAEFRVQRFTLTSSKPVKKFSSFLLFDTFGQGSHTWKDSSIAFRVSSYARHCLSLALTTNRTTVPPFVVAFARLWVPIGACGVSKTYL